MTSFLETVLFGISDHVERKSLVARGFLCSTDYFINNAY